jgi:hypothetical protein
MKYPRLLEPTASESVTLSTGKSISVPKATPVFTKWRGEKMNDTYGGKAVLDINGKPLFAELAILCTFLNEGWTGVWVDTYRNRLRTSWGDKTEVKLPAEQATLLEQIKIAAKSKNGCWDVFCWRDEDVIFAEAKRLRNDRLRPSQLNWLEASLKYGVSIKSFLLVEWSFA